MVKFSRKQARYALFAVGIFACMQNGIVTADDTEIYQSKYSSSATARPQVLIIVDDSGSMSTVIEGQRPPYEPTNSSYTYNGTNKHPSDRVYWSTNGVPPAAASNNYFLNSSNRCATSSGPLQNNGFFQTRALRWFAGGNEQFCFNFNGIEYCFPIPGGSAGWKSLSEGVKAPPHLDCEADVINSNPLNPGAANGYPQNTSTAGQQYAANPDGSLNWGSSAYTFYSAHYMDWYHDSSLRDDQTRLEIAQEVVSSLVEANTAIDFGLALFNENDGDDISDVHDGGRIVHRLIPDMTEGVGSDRENLVTTLNGTLAQGFTPLCESTMEVYRYLSGQSVVYGSERNPSNDLTAKDDLAESPAGTYDPPLTDCAYTYVILMTDGRPTYDLDANAAIESLTGKTCQNYLTDHGTTDLRKSCLPELAEYMATTDLDGDSSNGDQFGITYTIGFATDQQLLRDTAQAGKGLYFTADNADQLATAFQNAVLKILSTDTTFTSPAVAVDTFTRTQSRNEVFFAMFKPDSRIDWPGNIKRLNIDLTSGAAVLVDRSGVAAIAPGTGQIKTTASTVWSTVEDGPAVLEGGVGALLAARNPATRTIYSNTGNNQALQAYGSSNMTAAAFGLGSDAALYTFFGVSSQAEFYAALDWGAGYDLSDEDEDGATDDARPWILADMLHSKPLVVNYGARTASFTAANPDLRIIVGTNAGFLHMFGNDDGEEDWAFFAKELGPVLNKRRVNAVSSQHVYGIDAPAVVYTLDLNKDGTIDASVGDKAYLYFGLRRGGRILYALDISNPDSPEFLWRMDPTSVEFPDFAEMGQSWSVPVVTHIPGHVDLQGKPRPVLVFGAGYDTNKDSTGLATADSMGRGIYILDAVTGEQVWSVTPRADSLINMEEASLQHSVAGSVTVLDSNGDELTDRIYFADTGGQVWRVDLPGAELPDISQNTWRIVKLAAMNGGTKATDRRFFNAPDVVRTTYSGAAFDAILLGSGDRTNPHDMNDLNDPNNPDNPAVDNQFYMIRDMAIQPYFTAPPSVAECTGPPPSVDFRCQLPLGPGDLYDVTPNHIASNDTTVQAGAQLALASADGWRLDLEANGEKALARSLTIAGKVYFTTFAPEPGATNSCDPTPGTGRLYIVNLFNAAAERDFDFDGDTERSLIIGAILPDTPSPHFGSDGEIRLLLPPGSGSGSGSGSNPFLIGGSGNPFLTGSSIPQPYGSYWYREEY